MAVDEHDHPDDRRSDMLGRVMSLYAIAFFGGMPVGALLEGWIADYDRRR